MAYKDLKHLQHAYRLAQRATGTTGVNPAVGCVVVQNDAVVSTGVTGQGKKQGGRPHAEEAAMLQAGDTVYVTLEPCAHKATSDGLSCADRLIQARVKRVVIGYQDPDKRTSGKGIAQLKAAGIVVDVLEIAEITQLYQGFSNRIKYNRPAVSLKLATSLDGRIALENGESQWITGPEARQHGHLLRLKHDGILVGTQTALQDNPSLNCRLPGKNLAQPHAFVLDRQNRLENSPHHQITSDHIASFSIENILNYIALQGIKTLLVEGGGKLAASFLQANLIETIYWYHAPLILGSTGRAAIGEINNNNLQRKFKVTNSFSWKNGDALTILQQK